ncbi:MAG TPA: carbohydrate-binding domain-containing protein [Azospirillum sp.]|nr:carbohydrate-binding domain-containing protein [Azospirillum sp.]
MSTTSSGLIDTTLSITAYGQSAGGRWPHFTLRLNGVKIGETDVKSATPNEYTFTTQVSPDTPYTLQLDYDNDAWYNGQDLNLFVKSFEVNGNLIPVTDNRVTYDKGALDGKDVNPGQEGMYWKGALNVALEPAAFLPPPPPPADAPPTITSEIVVTAWGPTAGGYPPHFKLLVDGVMVGHTNVTSTATGYTFKAAVNPDEAHKIQVWYDNDGAANGVDRNLFVSRITIDGKEIKATDPLASYDIGVVDGKNVVAGQEGLYWGGALTFGVPEEYFGGAVVRPPPPPEPPPSEPAEIVVNASGTSAGGVAPHFKVLVDGVVIGQGSATSSTTTAYTFKANLNPEVAHKIQVQYDNDAVVNGQDRNLFVKSVSINGHEVKPTDSGVTYDRYALDGKDVIAGQEAMKWDGTLSLTAPSDYFKHPVLPPPTGPAFYVAANGKDTWSGKLAAPNADGTDGPFATLERARDAMRSSDIDTTYVREGTYQLSKTLELTSRDNGHAFKNYPGETPVLSGGERVTGFVDEGNGIFSAKVANGSDYTVTVGGERQHIAEKGAWDTADVKSGWFFADAASTGASKTALRFHSGDVSASDFAPGTKIQVFDPERMTDAIVEVSSINTSTHTIQLKTALPFAVAEGATYRLIGNSAFVDQVGEFGWRWSSDGALVMKPEDPAGFEQAGVIVARLPTLMKLTGTNGVTVEGLTFTDGTSWGAALELNGATNTKVGGNHFLNVGKGILLKGSSNNLIGGNEVEHTAAHGIELTGNSNKNKIYGNDIHNVGEIYKHVAGIMASGADDNVISHNDIAYSPRYGISIKNWNSTNINTGNVIEYNRILHTVQESADAGAIEILGRSSIDTGMLVRGNWIEDVGGIATTSSDQWLTKWKGFGVYLDDLTGGVTVQDNFLKNTNTAAVHIHGGDNNRVENNFSILGSNAEEFIRVGWNPNFKELGTPINNVIVKNVIAGTLPLDDYHELLTANNPTIDGNLVYNVPTFGYADREGNPMFIDAYGGNYALQPTSPALSMGIHDLAWSSMGDQGYTPSDTMPMFWDH